MAHTRVSGSLHRIRSQAENLACAVGVMLSTSICRREGGKGCGLFSTNSHDEQVKWISSGILNILLHDDVRVGFLIKMARDRKAFLLCSNASLSH